MRAKKIPVFLAAAMLCSCELGGRLDIQKVGDAAGYFIEFQCKLGETYNLVATELAPIDELQLLDYSLEFLVYITADETPTRLYQSIFWHPERDFIYNYGSSKTVSIPRNGVLHLRAVSPDGDEINATTTVPDQVTISSADFENNVVRFSYDLSTETIHNYYISKVSFHNGIEEVGSVLNFNNLSSETGASHEERVAVPSNTGEYDRIKVAVKRMTKDGFTYQLAIREISSSNSDNITFPVMLPGNIENAWGVFACYSEDTYYLPPR